MSPKKTTVKTTTKKKPVTSKQTKSTTKRSKKVLGPYDYPADFLNEMQEMLLQLRQELLEDVTRSVKEESDHLRFDVGDFYDHASEDRQRELALTLSNREREKLLMIDQALKRIEEGTYGICEVTGEKIGEERLRALPFTMLSVEAQEEIERGN
ncbi:MAG: TraR/DksA family transcriptional regulator [Thermodesulfobacteriota bacterium]